MKTCGKSETGAADRSGGQMERRLLAVERLSKIREVVMRCNRVWLGVCGIVLGQAATGLAGAGPWTISVGPDARLGMKVHATGSSYVQTLDISSATVSRTMPAPRRRTSPPGISRC